MAGQVQGKIAIVTGASNGIGRASPQLWQAFTARDHLLALKLERSQRLYRRPSAASL